MTTVDAWVDALVTASTRDELSLALVAAFGEGGRGSAPAVELFIGGAESAEELLRAVFAGADPLSTLRGLGEVTEWLDTSGTLDPERRTAALRTYISMAQQGEHARRFLRRAPAWLLEGPSEVATLEGARAAVALVTSHVATPSVARSAVATTAEQALRRFKAQESLRIFRDEVQGDSIEDTTARISTLASACIQVALETVTSRLGATLGEPRQENGTSVGFTVMALGKLGGDELNYSSDVDLIFVYETDEGHIDTTSVERPRSSTLSVHEYFVQLGRDFMTFMQQVTEDGYVFRVDMRLRPGGARGPLAHSIDALLDFYEAWGTTWQRTAWLKARPVAGDMSLGEQVLDRLKPFIFRRYLDFSALEEIAEMKRMVASHAKQEELKWRSRGSERWDIKVGHGGIREVEFAVQALQVVYGGQRSELRTGNTLQAIDRLTMGGILSYGDGDLLRDAYVFYRQLEHRVQMEQDRQTYQLALDAETLERFGRRLGMTGSQLEARLEDHQTAVSLIFATVMPGDSEEPEALDVQSLAAVVEEVSRDPEKADELAIFGFRNPVIAARQLTMLTDKPHLPFHRGARGRALTHLLLNAVIGSPDPDQALSNLTRLVTRVGTQSGYLDMLLANQELARLLVTLFGTSDFLSKRIASFPELIEQLSAPGWLSVSPPRAILEERLGATLGLVEPDDRERRLNLLRRFKYEHILRIGLRDVGRLADVSTIRAELSMLAEVLLQAVFTEARLELERRFGAPIDAETQAPAPMAVMALGKLGGGELSYASDLDLVFVYEGKGFTDGTRSIALQDYFGRLAQTLITFMSAHLREGRLYSIDTRLRPSGSQGALVTSLEGYKQYSLVEAEPWERQALLRGRYVAGDAPLGTRVMKVMADAAYPAASALDSSEMATAIIESRARLLKLAQSPEEQKSRLDFRSRRRKPTPNKGPFHHVKYGRGGLIDVEFTVQFVQLCHGAKHPELRSANTLEALRAAMSLGLLEQRHSHILESGYDFLMRLEDRLRIVHDQSIGGWRATPDEARRLALRMGYTGSHAGEALVAQWEAETNAVQSVFQEVVAGAASQSS